MTEELKPCHHCCYADPYVLPGPPYHMVDCPGCGAQGPTARTAKQAKKLWNTRAPAKVKPLVWERGVVDWARPMPGMKYVACSSPISAIGDEWSWWLDGENEPHETHGSEEAAKAAAQADYARRIREALK